MLDRCLKYVPRTLIVCLAIGVCVPWAGQVLVAMDEGYSSHVEPEVRLPNTYDTDTFGQSGTESSHGRFHQQIEPAGDAPQPKSPEASAAEVEVPEGFRLELVASEPLIKEPSCIAFDARGNLFVSELHGYNIEGYLDVLELNKTGKLDREVRRIRWELRGGKIAEEASRRQYGVVKRLIDSNDDGVMDRAEVWAGDLPPCYGMVPVDDGILVVCSPDILFLADRDGDGKAEVRETRFTGFQRRVMERGINNPRWGLDNWIYVGAGGQGGTITGPKLSVPVLLGNGDFRIRPDGSAIEPVNGRVGTFGLTMNAVGDRFPSSGGRPSIYALPLPYRYLKRNPYVATPETNHFAVTYNRGYRISRPHPWRLRRQQYAEWVKFYGERETDSNFFSGGCSGEIYTDKLFGANFEGNLFYCEPSLNLLHRCLISRDGAGYRGHRSNEEQTSELLASREQWFRPMNLRVGPEGALYIVDMYREIVEDYSAIPRFLQQQYGLEKGRGHGRIWRLVPEHYQREQWPDMTSLDSDELIRLTNAVSLWRRLTAQRLLIERGDSSIANSLHGRLRNSANALQMNHLLYTLQGIDELEKADVAVALDHDAYEVRLHGLRLSESWLAGDDSLLKRVANLADDPDPRIRIQVALTLGESRDPKVAGVLLRMAENYGTERWMSAAIASASSTHYQEVLMGILGSDEMKPGSRLLLRPLAATLAAQRDVPALEHLLQTILRSETSAQLACLNGGVDGLEQGDQAWGDLGEVETSLIVLLTTVPHDVRVLAVRLAVGLSMKDNPILNLMFRKAVAVVEDGQLLVIRRRQAMEMLAYAPFDVLRPVAVRMLNAAFPPELQLAAAESLGVREERGAGVALLEAWTGYTPRMREVVMSHLFSRVNRVVALLRAVEQGRIASGEISGIRREQLLRSGSADIAARARKLLVSPDSETELSGRGDLYRKALSAPRDHEKGKEIFNKHCLNCHRLGNKGFDVGPTLETILNKPDEGILLDLLDPSGKIEPDYRSYLLITRDGRFFTGLLRAESPTSVTLYQEKGQQVTILRTNIERVLASDVSLMPSNLHTVISPEGAADLIGYLRVAFQPHEKDSLESR